MLDSLTAIIPSLNFAMRKHRSKHRKHRHGLQHSFHVAKY